MSRKTKTNGSTALATVSSTPPALQVTRSEANARMKARALELYHEARAQRDERIRVFEAEYGRADRIDHTVLADLQRTQARLAGIAARQQRANQSGGEPKVAKFVDQLGAMIGAVSAHLPVLQADYIGWNGSGIGAKGQDEALLAGYEIVDDPLGPKNVTPTADEDGEVCLHTEIEPFEDEPSRGACVECGEEFELSVAADDDVDKEPEQHEPAPEPGDAE